MTFRDCTPQEEKILRTKGTCPFCGSKDFFEGPHGGMSVNIYCQGCDARFNLMGPFTPQVIQEPRVLNRVDVPEAKHRWWHRLIGRK